MLHIFFIISEAFLLNFLIVGIFDSIIPSRRMFDSVAADLQSDANQYMDLQSAKIIYRIDSWRIIDPDSDKCRIADPT